MDNYFSYTMPQLVSNVISGHQENRVKLDDGQNTSEFEPACVVSNRYVHLKMMHEDVARVNR